MSNVPQVKILLLGESAVGKTSLLHRFVDNTFSQSFVTTLGIEYKQREVPINGQSIMMQIWDAAGQERYKTITPSYYQKADGILLVFDITSQESFQGVDYWLACVREYANLHDIALVLIGNKIDLDDKRAVFEDEILTHDLPYFETSAKSGIGVREAFFAMAQKIMQAKPERFQGNSLDQTVQLKSPKKHKSSSKC